MRTLTFTAIALPLALLAAGCGMRQAPASGGDSAGACETVETLVSLGASSYVIVNGCGAADSSRPASAADIQRLG